MRMRLQLIYRFPDGGYCVNEPLYKIIPGTFLPVMPGILEPDGPNMGISPHVVLALDPTVECDIP